MYSSSSKVYLTETDLTKKPIVKKGLASSEKPNNIQKRYFRCTNGNEGLASSANLPIYVLKDTKGKL